MTHYLTSVRNVHLAESDVAVVAVVADDNIIGGDGSNVEPAYDVINVAVADILHKHDSSVKCNKLLV